MEVVLRKFAEEDVKYKVKWINDPRVNKYLHYELPLIEDKTLEWFKTLQYKKNRHDLTILYQDKPVGLIGILNIDEFDSGEFYIAMNYEYTGKGIASEATKLLLDKAFNNYGLKKVYLYTEKDNLSAQKLFEKIGFTNKKLVKKDIFYNNKFIDRYYYEIEN